MFGRYSGGVVSKQNALAIIPERVCLFLFEVGDLFGQEWLTRRYEQDQVFQAIDLCFQIVYDAIYFGAVRGFQCASDHIGEHLFGQATDKLILLAIVIAAWFKPQSRRFCCSILYGV